MGGKSGANQKKGWINQIMCGFHKYEQSIYEGQLSTSKDGSHFTESGGFLEDVNVRWFVWI